MISSLTALSHPLEIQIKKQSYIVLAEGIEFQHVKNNLSEEDYVSFLQTRTEVLNRAAQGLQALKVGFGIGVIIKDHFYFRAEKKLSEQLTKEAEGMNQSQREDILQAVKRSEHELAKNRKNNENKTFKEKSDALITLILNKLDAQLWTQAAIVSHANEFGVLAAIGLQAEGGNSAGVGRGGLTDIGLSFGYNKDEKSMAFQFFNGRETFKSTDMPIIMIAGLVGKAGFYAANQGKDLSAQGTSFYPPVAPAFSTSTNRSVLVGFSSGLTWPPSPIGDLLTYTNQMKQTTLVRLTLSPLTKGFVRLKFGAVNELLSATLVGIKDLISFFRSETRSVQCERLF